jgi:hypothetical protein
MQCKICSRECHDVEFLRRHVSKSHGSSTRDYVLQFELDNIIPLCACDCGQEVTWHQPSKRFNTYIHGHHAQFRMKSEDERRAIGTKNSVNMRRYYAENTDIAHAKNVQLRAGHTSEIEQRRIDNIRNFWSSDSELTKQRRKEASDRAIKLLELGLIGPHAPFKAEWVMNPFTGRKEYMHSSWETLFLQACVENQIPVTKAHSLRIPYVGLDNCEHVYVPDFVTLEEWAEPTVFEIKGQRTSTDDLKEAACREWCRQNGFEMVVVGLTE